MPSFELELEVFVGGEPARGTVRVEHSESLGRLHAAFPPTPSTLDRVRPQGRALVDGRLVIEPPAGQCTSLRLHVGSVWRDLWFEPLTANRRERVDLNDPSTAVRVQLLDETSLAPIVGETVSASWSAVDLRPPSVDLTGRLGLQTATAENAATDGELSATTDADGLCWFRREGPGTFLVSAPGCAFGDPPPFTQRLVLAGPIKTGSVTLLRPAARHRVSLLVRADITRRPGVRPFLVAQRVNGGVSADVPIPGVLVPGEARRDVELPAGTWRFEVFPIGEARVVGTTGLLEVPGSSAHTVDLDDAESRTTLQLAGVKPGHYPVRVTTRPADARHTHRYEVRQLGPKQWSRQAVEVPTIPHAVRIVARNRSNFYLSSTPVELATGNVTVELAPATLVRVRWTGTGNAAADGNATLVIKAANETFLRAMHPELGPRAGRLAPTWIGELVVPTDSSKPTVDVECVSEDGATLWRLQGTPRHGVLSLDVDSSQS